MGSRDLQLLTDEIYTLRDSFESMLVDPTIKFEREAEFAVQILQGNDYMLGIARQGDGKASLLAAVHNIAAIGISLNPAKKQAYLVPRKGKICLDLSYMGLMDLAVTSGAIKWAQAEVVHASDLFELNGYEAPPTHKFKPFGGDRGEIVGVYCVAKRPDGTFHTATMTVQEVNDIRDRSEAWKSWISKQKSCPWVTDWAEMAKKTIVKRASKYWIEGLEADRSGRVQQAIHYLNTEGEEGLAEINERAAKRPPAPVAPADLKTEAEAAAKKGLAAYQEFWKAAGKENRTLLAGEHERLKDIATKADAARTIDNEAPGREPGQDDEERGQ
jgi:recombination protein RecT